MATTSATCRAQSISWLGRLSRGFQHGARIILLLVLAVWPALRPAHGAESSTITLRDGSSIIGEVVSLHDGIYTVRSAMLGTVTINQSEVASLTNGSAGQASIQVDALKEQLTTDPDTMRAIVDLADLPDVQAVLSDPDIRAALQSGNLDALLANPKLVHLVADPRFQDMTKKITH